MIALQQSHLSKFSGGEPNKLVYARGENRIEFSFAETLQAIM